MGLSVFRLRYSTARKIPEGRNLKGRIPGSRRSTQSYTLTYFKLKSDRAESIERVSDAEADATGSDHPPC